MKLPSTFLKLALHLDKAIETGLTAAYPLVLNLPAPPDGVQWKAKARLGLKLVKEAGRQVLIDTAEKWKVK